MVVADHVQRVVRPNFAASWDEIGDENQIEETFALSTMKDIPGKIALQFLAGLSSRGVNLSCTPSHYPCNIVTTLVCTQPCNTFHWFRVV